MTTLAPQRLTADAPALPGVLSLLHRAFAYLDGRIDPPSSLTRMTHENLSEEANRHQVWAILEGDAPIACMILTPKPATLYLGKLATDPRQRGRGLARVMINQAETIARALALPSITLQTRIELLENHATFRALGFVATGETTHPGYTRPTSLTFTKQL
ncbi:GNAT family N-acetyltransferase [Rhodalgimonas zhirmunskyi]|uniref:GNAT family N-acetyltransferase n=1 Tax=Rhodalgimonas zhirmunskyi TaxID=2964767 RepID=A0AAJ1X7J9_9RHOB|nr:GNAT family N-acetyltransferase [Rhodoalgimonas zhirmunskyi]MDQ2095769.1 GNAT family N-acetyltransferase [Rhodoalgimonas zhirmunskyi]